jgi:hypothetical protein
MGLDLFDEPDWSFNWFECRSKKLNRVGNIEHTTSDLSGMAPCAVVEPPVLRDEEVCGSDLERMQQRRVDDVVRL